MRAVTGFALREDLGVGLRGVSDVKHPSCGCRLRKHGGVREGVGEGVEQTRGGRRGLM